MRLIDADAIKLPKGFFEEVDTVPKFYEWLNTLPTVDPVKHGKWIWLSSTYDRVPCEMRFWCSECHHETILHSNETSYPWERFCPNCGARMDGERSKE